MKPIRVLVVDDSAFMRKAIREMLEKDAGIEVVGIAWSGKDALEQIARLQPDVVTTDLYMPDLDGVGLIREQMERQPVPMVVISSADETGEKVLAAMDAGAVEFVRKPTAMALEKMYNIQEELVQAVQAAAAVPFEKLTLLKNGHMDVRVESPVAQNLSPVYASSPAHAVAYDAVLIGVSTGGPRALRTILPRLPADLPVPVAIVLHMPPGYTQPLAHRLDETCPLEVLESTDGLEMKPGRVILAQAGIHTLLKPLPDGRVITRLSHGSLDELYVPAVDLLFESGAEAYGGRVLGVVLTGMGSDGTKGAAWIKAGGGKVIVEAESTSVVFGMPRSVIEAGLADRVVPLDRIPEAIQEELL